MRTKTFVRILIVVAIGIPVLLELSTLARLIGAHVEEGGGASENGIELQTVGVGDDLLPATPQSEKLTGTLVLTGRAHWTFELEIRVRNDEPTPYRLTLTDLRTADGTLVREPASRQWAPGEESTLRASWEIPTNDSPHYLVVTGTRHLESDSARAATRRIAFGKVPVRNADGP